MIGLGRFGTALALELVERGTEVLAIDRNPKTVQSLSGRLPHVVAADTTDPEVFEQLGIGDFQRAVVAIGSDIQASILSTSLLADLEIPNIWPRPPTSSTPASCPGSRAPRGLPRARDG